MDEVEVICSAKGCRADATSALRWRNPRIHTGGREKTWVACDEHRDGLADFLARRDFLLRVEAAPAAGGEDGPTLRPDPPPGS